MKREIRWRDTRDRDIVWIAWNNPRISQGQFGHCPKESLEEHYE